MGTFNEKLAKIQAKHKVVTEKPNKINEDWYNGVFDR